MIARPISQTTATPAATRPTSPTRAIRPRRRGRPLLDVHGGAHQPEGMWICGALSPRRTGSGLRREHRSWRHPRTPRSTSSSRVSTRRPRCPGCCPACRPAIGRSSPTTARPTGPRRSPPSTARRSSRRAAGVRRRRPRGAGGGDGRLRLLLRRRRLDGPRAAARVARPGAGRRRRPGARPTPPDPRAPGRCTPGSPTWRWPGMLRAPHRAAAARPGPDAGRPPRRRCWTSASPTGGSATRWRW